MGCYLYLRSIHSNVCFVATFLESNKKDTAFDIKIAFELTNGEYFVTRWACNKSKGFIAETMLDQIECINNHYIANPFAA